METLPSTVQSRVVEQRVMSAARAQFGRDTKSRTVIAFYENGHWWVKVNTDEATMCFDVVDTNSGFDFEQV